MVEQLDFVYLPSRDVAAELTYFTDGLGATLVFAIEASRLVRLAPDPPALLLAGHLDGDSPVLVYRVESLDQTVSKLARSGIEVRARFEIPHGPGVELRGAGPQRVAVYQTSSRSPSSVGGTGSIS